MIECPKCGSRLLRPSRPQNFSERTGWLKLRVTLRCIDCQNRFIGPLIVWKDLLYAHCPGCHRMDLNSWRGMTFDAPFWMGLKIRLGARRWRCEYCRINFASFRPRKEVFTFNRWKKFVSQAGGKS